MTGDQHLRAEGLYLQAVTVSVNYADYLECIAPNMRHFDRWLVVTVESDVRTQEVCRRWGMEVLFSTRLYENGARFHKAAALNEGLGVLRQDAWTVVLDSDILLPSDFRARLDAQSLERPCLYGISGRRICRTAAEFRHLAAREPWGEGLLYSHFVIGYFQMFHLGQPHNRFPEDGAGDASGYDVYFSQRFPGHQHRYLPFTALHAGESTVNWQGRTADPFFPEDGEETPAPDAAPEIAAAAGGPGRHAVLIGCWRGELTRVLAAHFATVTVIDHWGLLAPGLTAAAENGRRSVAARYHDETAGLANVTAPLPHTEETIAAIPPGSVDLLWLAPEPDYDFLLNALPQWLPRLRAGGGIAGGFCLPAFPGAASTVQLLLGAPDRVYEDGQWLRTVPDPASWAARRLRFPAPPAGGRCVVYVCCGRGEVEGLLVSLSSLQEHWTGPVCVLCAAEDEPSLRMACARLGVTYINTPVPALGTPPLVARLESLEWAPGDDVLLLGNATLVLGPVEPVFDAAGSAGAAMAQVSPVRPGEAALECFVWKKDAAVPGELCRHALQFRLGIVATVAAFAVRHPLPAELVWTGAQRRTPDTAAVTVLHRLARGGTQRALPAWEQAEQRLMARLAGED